MPQGLICREVDIPVGNTVVDWLNFFRDECENYIERQPQEIGGMDAQGEPITWRLTKAIFFTGSITKVNGDKVTEFLAG